VTTARILKQITVADPRSSWDGRTVDVLIGADGALQDIVASGSALAKASGQEEIADARGDALAPAWADLWVHSPEPGHENRGNLSELAAEAYWGGVADLGVMPTTLPVLDSADAVTGLQARSKGLATRLHAIGALTVKCAGQDLAELLDLRSAGAVAYSDAERPVQRASLLLRALQYAELTGAAVLQSPLDASLAQGQHAAESALNTRLGFKGISPLAETLALQRDIAVAAVTKTPIHFSPITTAAGAQLIREAKAKGISVTASTSPVYLLGTDAWLSSFDTRYKVMPPLRTELDRAALCQAMADGTLDVVTSHHQPLTREEKELEWDYALPGVTGLGVLFAASYTALVLPGLMGLGALVERLAHAPRRVLGLPNTTVELGATRLVRISPSVAVASPESIPSYDAWQAHTWPYAGMSLYGRVQPLW
jgi:dihydroorotase